MNKNKTVKSKKKKKTETQTQKFNKFKKYIEDRVEYFSSKLMLFDFNTVQFCSNKTDLNQGENGTHTVLCVKHIPHYHQIKITTFPVTFDLFLNKDFDILDRALIHELSHIHTTKLLNLANRRSATELEITEANEELVETITQYLLVIKKLKKLN